MNEPKKNDTNWAGKIADEVANFTRGMLFGGDTKLMALQHSLSGPAFPREANPELYDSLAGMNYDQALQHYTERRNEMGSHLNLPDSVPFFGGENIPELGGNIVGGIGGLGAAGRAGQGARALRSKLPEEIDRLTSLTPRFIKSKLPSGEAIQRYIPRFELGSRGRWRDLAALGTGEGALAGYGYSEPGREGRGAIEGAATGFAFAGVGVPLGAKVISLAKNIAKPGYSRLSRLISKASEGADLDELAADPNMTLADLRPELQALSRESALNNPAARETLKEVMGERLGERVNRVNTSIYETLKPRNGELLNSTGIGAIDASRQILQRDMYRQVFAPPSFPQGVYVNWRRATPSTRGGQNSVGGSAAERGLAVNDPDVAVRDFMNSRAFKESVPGMLKKYENPYGVEPYRDVVMKNNRGKVLKDADGNPTTIREYSLAFVVDVYKELGETAHNFFKGPERKPAQGHRFETAAEKGRNAILALSPHWNYVQSFSGQTIRMNKAFQEGRKAVENGISIRDMKAGSRDLDMMGFDEIKASQRAYETQKIKHGFEKVGASDDATHAYLSGFAEATMEMIEAQSGNKGSLNALIAHNFTSKLQEIAPKSTGRDYLTSKINREIKFLSTENQAMPSGARIPEEVDAVGIAGSVARNVSWANAFSRLEIVQRLARMFQKSGEDRLYQEIAKALVSKNTSMIKGGRRYDPDLAIPAAMFEDSPEREIPEHLRTREVGRSAVPADATRTRNWERE